MTHSSVKLPRFSFSLTWIIVSLLITTCFLVTCRCSDQDEFIEDYFDRVPSTAPGFKCKPTTLGEDASVKVTVCDDRQENKTDLLIQGGTCYLIPRPRPKLGDRYKSSYIKMSGNESYCIELHNEADCGGKYDQIRPEYRGNRTLHNLELEIPLFSAKSISLCGAFCNKTIAEINPVMEANPGPGMVSLYHEFGYYGYPIHVNLSAGCVEIESVFAVIRTYGTCVILYSSPHCAEKSGEYSYQTSGKSLEYYEEKMTSSTIPIFPKSLQFCRETDIQGIRYKFAKNSQVCKQIGVCKTTCDRFG